MPENKDKRNRIAFAVCIAIISFVIAYTGRGYDNGQKQKHARVHPAAESKTHKFACSEGTSVSTTKVGAKSHLSKSWQKHDETRVKTLMTKANLLNLNDANMGLLQKLPHTKTLRGVSLGVIKKQGRHTRYKQYINGIPVYGHEIILHKDDDGDYYTGRYIDAKTDSNKAQPNINAQHAFNIAKHAFKGAHSKTRNEHVTLTYFTDHKGVAHLAYDVSFDTNGFLSDPLHPRFIIDADNAQILKRWDETLHVKIGTGPGGNEKIGEYEYGTDKPYLDITRNKQSNACALSSPSVATYNIRHREDLDDVMKAIKKRALKPVTFVCPRHVADDEVNGGYSPVNDAHYFGTVIVDMYQSWYKQKPLPFKLKFLVHYSVDWENAAWDPEYKVMMFGDGASEDYPLIALDVTSHEIGHGVTQRYSNLAYFDESGGLNESFSDMAGKAAEYYENGKNTWTLGASVSKTGEPIRYMDKPSRDGISIDDAREFEEDMNPHHSSGVFNRLFYQLATRPDWNTHKAFDVMFYANKHYWSKMTDYNLAAEGAINSAKTLGYDESVLVSSIKQVGIACAKKPGHKRYTCEISEEPLNNTNQD